MRRPRSKLQVSTFPFLAVLLCAMGSLLLLLFIMDRRAKIAAQHHAAELLSKKEKRSTADEDARKAEWEQAKEKLRRSLMTEHAKLAERTEAERRKIAQSGQTLEVIRAQHIEAEAKIAAESAKIGELRLAIESQRSGITKSTNKATATNTELLEAAKELADLEVTLRQLRALKTEEQAVYSLIPYRGRQGEFRKPIYVECVASGVIFQPDGHERLDFGFTMESIREAIETRAGKLVPQPVEKDKGRAELKEKTGPYVLFLVRPDGITSYYKAQAVLRGYQIDFGYELIDAEWTFDFAKGRPQSPPGVAMKPREQIHPRTPGTLPPPSGSTIAGSSPLGAGGSLASIAAGIETPNPTFGVRSPVSSVSPLAPSLPNGQGPAYPRVDTGIPVQRPSFVPVGKMPSTEASFGQPIASNNPDRPLLPIKPPESGNGGSTSPNPPSKNGSPLDRSAPEFGGAEPKEKPAPVPPLGRIIGDKDFVITLDSYAEHITVFPGGTQFRWKNADDTATDTALLKHVANLIARRQASVRPDEPPYRPVIRFQVSTEGVQTFLRAYPILEPLRVPMTKENVQD